MRQGYWLAHKMSSEAMHPRACSRGRTVRPNGPALLHRIGIVHLFDASGAQHRNPIGHLHRFHLIMRHENIDLP